MSLYLYAAGAKKNVISMMNHLGLSSSYSALMRHLLALMKSQMTSIAGIARLRRILIIFDNINFANKIVEQRTGKTGTYHAHRSGTRAKVMLKVPLKAGLQQP